MSLVGSKDSYGDEYVNKFESKKQEHRNATNNNSKFLAN